MLQHETAMATLREEAEDRGSLLLMVVSSGGRIEGFGEDEVVEAEQRLTCTPWGESPGMEKVWPCRDAGGPGG